MNGCCFILNAKNIEEVNFYISEVLLLMKYDSLAEPFRLQCKSPSWISPADIQSLRETRRAAPIINREDFKNTMARIHHLIQQQGFVQASPQHQTIWQRPF